MMPDHRSGLRGGTLARLAGMLCQNRTFRDWVCGQPMYQGSEVVSPDDAAEFVREACGVDSRAMLDHDAAAAQRFHTYIRLPYVEYLKAVEGSPTLFRGYRLTREGRDLAIQFIACRHETFNAYAVSVLVEPHMVPVKPWPGATAAAAAIGAAEQVIFDLKRMGRVERAGREIIGGQMWRAVR